MVFYSLFFSFCLLYVSGLSCIRFYIGFSFDLQLPVLVGPLKDLAIEEATDILRSSEDLDVDLLRGSDRPAEYGKVDSLIMVS